jgi:hypothetical protein
MFLGPLIVMKKAEDATLTELRHRVEQAEAAHRDVKHRARELTGKLCGLGALGPLDKLAMDQAAALQSHARAQHARAVREFSDFVLRNLPRPA